MIWVQESRRTWVRARTCAVASWNGCQRVLEIDYIGRPVPREPLGRLSGGARVEQDRIVREALTEI